MYLCLESVSSLGPVVSTKICGRSSDCGPNLDGENERRSALERRIENLAAPDAGSHVGGDVCRLCDLQHFTIAIVSHSASNVE